MSRGDFLKGISVAAAGFVATGVGLSGVAKAQEPEPPDPCEKIPPDYMECAKYGPAHVFSTLAAAVDTLFPGPEGLPILIMDQFFNPVPADTNNPNPMMNLGAEGIDTTGAVGYIPLGIPNEPGPVPPSYSILYISLPSQTQTKNIIDLIIFTLDQLVFGVNYSLIVPELVPVLVPLVLEYIMGIPGCPPEPGSPPGPGCTPEAIEQATQIATQMAPGLVLYKNLNPDTPYAFKDLPYGNTSEIIFPTGDPQNPIHTGVYRKGRYTILHYMDTPELLREFIPEDTVVKAKKLFETLYFFTAFDYYSEFCNIVPSGEHPDGSPIYERNKDGGFDIFPGSVWDQMRDVKGEDLGPYFPNSYGHNYMPEAKPDYAGLVVKLVDKKPLKWVK
jgi:hypothetical protein